ncbi:MAG: zf-HC2 domain-containing protein [Armatimonadota bacterium]|nr:MAG: zf-HC2 domain-containing protein [Armatimonadota bacterium]
MPPRECEKLRERLPEFADGSLSGPDRARLESHLGQCPRCAAELEDLRTVMSAVRSIEPDEVPENLLPRLRQAVRERALAPTGLTRLWPRIAVPVALAVGVVAISFSLRAPRRAAPPEGAQDRYVTAQAPTKMRARVPPRSARAAVRESVAIAQAPRAAVEELPLPDAQPRGAKERRGLESLGRGERLELKDELATSPAPPPTVSEAVAETIGPPEPSAESPLAIAEPEGASAPIARAGHGGFGGGGARGGSAPRMSRAPSPPSGSRAAAPRAFDAHEEDRRPCDAWLARRAKARADAEVPPPPFTAKAMLVQQEAGPAIALHLASEEPAVEISVYLGRAPERQLIWQGSPPKGASIVLTSEHVTSTPAAIPLALESASGARNYVLFVPTMARLGETAPSAPRGTYRAETLSQVLAEFTALTGLVVLAEEPLSQALHGDRPAGPPDAALQEIAAKAGLEIERAGDIVFDLTHPR